MTTHQAITREQGKAIIEARRKAYTTLTGYARYIDIPGVPETEDISDKAYKVVETPLALHHIVILNALQLLVDGLLVYDAQVLDSPVDFRLLRGAAPTRPGDRPDGGVGQIQAHDPSLNFKFSNAETPIPDSGNTSAEKSALYELRQSLSAEISRGNTPENPDFASAEARYAAQLAIKAVLEGEMTPADALEIVSGQVGHFSVCKRVMLMLPPGSAKSTYATVVFPTWVMGKIRAFETILTGWGDPICRRHGKRARQICASKEYESLFGTGLDPNTRAAEDWQLTNYSSYKSSGVNSGVAGFRTHGLVWDDLTKNRKEADSEGIRTDVWNAYIDDARSRKTPSAWEVGIGTRWHEDEIMGRILPEGYAGESGFMKCRDGNVWLVICMAAECERPGDEDPLGRQLGEMIWPEWFSEEYWAEKRVNPRSWASLYQQRPAPVEGILFKRENFKRYSKLPPGDNYIAYDPGVSDTGDDTSIQVWRVDEMARMYLVDRFKKKCSMDVWIVQLLAWVGIYKPLEAVSEAGLIRRAAEPWIMRAMRKAKRFFTQVWVNRSANKQAMAAGAVAMVNSGQVFLPNNSDGEEFLDACLRFPASKDDHDVDAFVNLCMRLETIWEAHPPQPSEKKVVVISGEIPIKSLMPPRFPKKVSRWAHRKQ